MQKFVILCPQYYSFMPSPLNPNLNRFTTKASLYAPKTYVEGILNGERVWLSRSITLVESTVAEHQEIAQQIVEACLPYSGKSWRIGITGSPGVGKSTFIEASGLHLLKAQHRIAVLAIDPSSQRHHGSILGDKTRMEKLSRHKNAFIRPSPAGTTLGGVARKTRESIILCEAAGFDLIFVETVGVGQSEIAVHSMVDCFLLLLQPGAGDELQGIKRGIVEMADLLFINKADQALKAAQRTREEYRRALHLFPMKENQWTSQIFTGSALEKESLEPIWKAVEDFFKHLNETDFLARQRQQQAIYWLQESIQQVLEDWFFEKATTQTQLDQLQQQVVAQQLSPFAAAEKLLQERLKT